MGSFYFCDVGGAKQSDSVAQLANFIPGDKNNMQSSSNKKNIWNQHFLFFFFFFCFGPYQKPLTKWTSSGRASFLSEYEILTSKIKGRAINFHLEALFYLLSLRPFLWERNRKETRWQQTSPILSANVGIAFTDYSVSCNLMPSFVILLLWQC